jgi:hypothetical protein
VEQLREYREKWDDEGKRVRRLRCLVGVLVGQPLGGGGVEQLRKHREKWDDEGKRVSKHDGWALLLHC